MNTTTAAATTTDPLISAYNEIAAAGDCWSCGATATRPDGLCADCGTIDAQAVPDIHSPTWKGNTKPMEAIFVAPPNAKRVW